MEKKDFIEDLKLVNKVLKSLILSTEAKSVLNAIEWHHLIDVSRSLNTSIVAIECNAYEV